MVALGSPGELGPEAFVNKPGQPSADPGASQITEGLSLHEQVEALERSLIARTMAAVSGNQSEAARRLGVSRGSLIDRLKKYGLASSSTL
jgi:two-component system response regulator AtoC